jgi:hypothetical protein
MTWSRCPPRGLPEAPLPLQIKAINWPPANKIDAYNDNLVMAITEVIAGHMIPTENHLISSKIYVDSTLRHKKTMGKG